MTDWNFSFPVTAEMYTLLAAHLNSALNPILYAIFNPSFNKGYIKVLRCITRQSTLFKDKGITNSKNFIQTVTLQYGDTTKYNKEKN